MMIEFYIGNLEKQDFNFRVIKIKISVENPKILGLFLLFPV